MQIKLAILFLFLSSLANAQAVSKPDSLANVLNGEKSETKKLELVIEVMMAYGKSDFEKALKFARLGVTLADQSNDKVWKPKVYYEACRYFADNNLVDSSSLLVQKALDGFKVNNDKNGMAKAYFQLAWLHLYKGQVDLSLEKAITATKLMEEINDKEGICKGYNKISEYMGRLDRKKEAIDYAKKAIAFGEENNLNNLLYDIYRNAGNVYTKVNAYDTSLYYFNKTLQIANEQNSSNLDIAGALSDRGRNFIRMERYQDALKDYEKALVMANESNYKRMVGICYQRLGMIHSQLGNYSKALDYQLKGKELAIKSGATYNITDVYSNLADTYERLKDYPKALEYQRLAFEVADSMSSVQNETAMAEMFTKYETEKKEVMINSQQALIAKQQLNQWLSIGLVALLLILIAVGLISYRNRTKTHRLLSAKNAENELLLKEIHHRVKNNLEVVSGLLALQSAQIEDEGTKEAMREGQNRVNSIGIVHQKLYQGKTLGSVEMKDYFLNLSENILDTFGASERIQLDIAMNELNLDIDTAVPLGLIVNELITNALKYAFPEGRNGTISIQLQKQTNGVLHLEVADNGAGKSDTTQGTGFGSQLIALLTKQLNGAMREENHLGTRFILDFSS